MACGSFRVVSSGYALSIVLLRDGFDELPLFPLKWFSFCILRIKSSY